MRASLFVSMVFGLTILAPTGALCEEVGNAPSEAKLPLSELLRLYRESEEAKRKREPEPPPIPATVQKVAFEGRLLDTAVDLTADFQIAVLSDQEWVKVPLIERDAVTYLSSLPVVEGAAFAIEESRLFFLTRRRGNYSFQISLLKRAEPTEQRRKILVKYTGAILASCRISFDRRLFRIMSPSTGEGPDGVSLFPQGNAFVVEWMRTGAAAPKKPEAARLPVEPVIPMAKATTVSTLEGKRITRVRYDMHLAGVEPIEVTLPRDARVERIYLNGVPIPAPSEDEKILIEAAPTREGDEAGVLELVLSDTDQGYFLSGAVVIPLPRVSWRVNELFLDVHLPEVFNYTWAGGSLAPVEKSPKVAYIYPLPLPGKRLMFHQELISSSAPNVTLHYKADLEGHYFRP